jgi:hypothetical protein
LTGQRIHPHRKSSVPTNGIAAGITGVTKGGSYLGAARRAFSFWDPVSSPAVTHLRKDRGLVPTRRTVRALSGGM